jgi:HlyD family secretion protein
MKPFVPGRRLSLIIYGTLFLAAVVSLWFIFRTKPVKVERGFVTRGSFKEKIALDGRIRSRTKITLVAFASGDIDEIKLKKGDLVRKGEKIAMLHWDIHKAIESPIDGVVVDLHRTSPGPVNRGDHLLDIIDLNALEIIAEPLTSDALRMTTGNAVDIAGFGDDLVYRGRVQEVSRAGYVKVSALGVEEERTEIRIGMTDVPRPVLRKLGEEFHVELAVQVYEQDDVLKVPLGALFKSQNQWAVFKVVENRAHQQIIEVGQRNEREAILVSGLSEGEEIILFPSDMVIENIKVE